MFDLHGVVVDVMCKACPHLAVQLGATGGVLTLSLPAGQQVIRLLQAAARPAPAGAVPVPRGAPPAVPPWTPHIIPVGRFRAVNAPAPDDSGLDDYDLLPDA